MRSPCWRAVRGALLGLLLCLHPAWAQTEPHSYDVIVYGGTASGAIAAIAAAEEGASVALLEPGSHIGGMVSGGLSHTDVGNRAVIGGLALRFHERVAGYYAKPLWHYLGPEPHVAERILRDWLDEAGVDVFFEHRILSARKDSIAGRRIERITLTPDGNAFHGRVFVDASYEGDLMTRAGVSYTVGRESVRRYGESWAGRQPIRFGPFQFPSRMPISPFVNETNPGRPRPGYPGGPLLPLIHESPMVEVGEADGGISSYNFRRCVTSREDNRVPFTRPPDYDPARFELARRWFASTGNDYRLEWVVFFGGGIPNDKFDLNSAGPLSTNLLDGSNWEYPDADYDRRREIWDRHLRYTQEFLYFLANDPVEPDSVRVPLREFGLCKDEFADTEHWPHQMYVREARRMIGEYVLTQADLEEARAKYDAVGLGSHPIDSREVQRVWTWNFGRPGVIGETVNEGFLRVIVDPYEIPYRSLTPRFAEAENLLVPAALSASHVAYSSIRMEPQYMVLGHAAGVAAAMAARDDQAVQRVDIVDLRRRLREQGQMLELTQLSDSVRRASRRLTPVETGESVKGAPGVAEPGSPRPRGRLSRY